MTCIIGLQEDGIAYIGADSASSNEWETRRTAIRKVFKCGEYIIGYTTSFRMGQILQHNINYPVCDEPTEEFMVKEFVEIVRKGLKDFGYSKIESNEETGGQFIVGVKGKIFEIGSDYQVGHTLDGLTAVGCGWMFALGAMKANEMEIPIRRIMKSLEVAEYFSGGVRSPFTVLSTEGF